MKITKSEYLLFVLILKDTFKALYPKSSLDTLKKKILQTGLGVKR